MIINIKPISLCFVFFLCIACSANESSAVLLRDKVTSSLDYAVEKQWSELYRLRDSAYKEAVSLDVFIKDMEARSENMSLTDYQLQKQYLDFEDYFAVNFRYKLHRDGELYVFSGVQIWKYEEGELVCVDAGLDMLSPLLAAISGSNSPSNEDVPKLRSWAD